jgi:hypothetical protein
MAAGAGTLCGMSRVVHRPRSGAGSAAERLSPLHMGAVRDLLPAALAAGMVLLLGIPTLILPLYSDQALFAIAGKTVASGGFPYVDAWDVKPPGVYLVYALAVQGPFGIDGNVRAFDLVWTALTAAVLAELGRRWWSARAGILAGLFFGVVWSTAAPWLHSAQPDSLCALPVVLALLLYEASTGRKLWLVAAGVLLGFAFQMRFTVALLIPFFPLVDMLGRDSGRARLWLHRMVWLGIGFAAVQAVLAVYLAAGGALGEYIATMRYAAGYARKGGPYNPPDGPSLGSYLWALRLAFWNWGFPRLVLVGPAVAGGFIGALVLRERRVMQLGIFAVLIYAGIAMQAKFFWYHYGVIVPVLALVAGWAWDRLIAQLCHVWPAAVAWGAAGLMAAVLLLASTDVFDSGWDYWRGSLAAYRDSEARQRYFQEYSLPAHHVADHVRARSEPGDTIYVWGFKPAIYLLAERKSASRFLQSFPLMSDWAPPRWQREFLRELEQRRPVYFIVERGGAGNWVVGHDIDKVDYIARLPDLQQWLDTGYEQEVEIEGYILYRRRAAAP